MKVVELPELSEDQKKLREDIVMRDFAASDPRLHTFLNRLFGPNDENEEAVISMTFVADGAVISGVVISEKAWAVRLGDMLTQAGAQAAAEDLALIAEQVAEGSSAIEEQASAWPPSQRKFVHLKNASTGFGAAALVNARVDLRRVSAWSIGGVVEEVPTGS